MKSRAVRYNFRKLRVASKIKQSAKHPRLSVYRSLKYIYAQVIDDVQGKTLVAASSFMKKTSGQVTGVKAATLVGEAIGKKALAKGVNQVVFDRGARAYTGQIKALADGARQAGLKF